MSEFLYLLIICFVQPQDLFKEYVVVMVFELRCMIAKVMRKLMKSDEFKGSAETVQKVPMLSLIAR